MPELFFLLELGASLQCLFLVKKILAVGKWQLFCLIGGTSLMSGSVNVLYLRIFAGGTLHLAETRITSIAVPDTSEVSQSHLKSAEVDTGRIGFRCFWKPFCAKQLYISMRHHSQNVIYCKKAFFPTLKYRSPVILSEKLVIFLFVILKRSRTEVSAWSWVSGGWCSWEAGDHLCQ